MKPRSALTLVVSLFSIFFQLLLYRRYSLLHPSPHRNLTLKRQQQHNGLSSLSAWPLHTPAASRRLFGGQKTCANTIHPHQARSFLRSHYFETHCSVFEELFAALIGAFIYKVLPLFPNTVMLLRKCFVCALNIPAQRKHYIYVFMLLSVCAGSSLISVLLGFSLCFL